MDRDRTKQLTEHAKEVYRKKQELNLTKHLRKEVEVGANGTLYCSRYRRLLF